MKRTIIYVFGPKRMRSTYYDNGEMIAENGGWLKIGLATADEKNDNDKWDVAKNRCDQEGRTGLCETCQLFDVFEYPTLSNRKYDDEVRRILADEVYTFNTSKNNNKLVDDSQYEIRAGQEFVYGATRKHILSAIAKFERDLILEFHAAKENLTPLLDKIQQNNNDVSDEIDESAPVPKSNSQKVQETDDFFSKIISKLPEEIKNKCNHSSGRAYMSIKNKNNYFVKFSTRYSTTSVSVEVFGGEESKRKIEEYIEENKIRENIPNLSNTKQGVKNKNKYYWEITGDYVGDEDGVVQWFVDNVILMYNEFER